MLMSEAALYYGLLMAKVAPDVAMIPFAMAMLWSLVRLNESGDGRWWLAAGLFAGLALLSKGLIGVVLPALREELGLTEDKCKTVRVEGAPIPLRPRKKWDNGKDVVVAGEAAGCVAPASGEGATAAPSSQAVEGEA